jgi:hypothetical protein
LFKQILLLKKKVLAVEKNKERAKKMRQVDEK